MNQQNSEREYRYQLASTEARAFVREAEQYMSLDVHNKDRPVSYTRTTYFDAPNRALAKSCHEHVTHRLRVRQYASSTTTRDEPRFERLAFLEFKKSSGATRVKSRYGTHPEALKNMLFGNSSATEEAEREALESEPTLGEFAKAIRRNEYQQVFSTWYRRMSLSCPNVRITIDENVHFCSPQPIGMAGTSARPNHTFNVLSGRIVEIKLAGATPPWLATAMTALPATSTPSKFQRGLAAIELPSRKSIAGTRPLSLIPTPSSLPHD